MNREDFLGRIAQRLGRVRGSLPAMRAPVATPSSAPRSAAVDGPVHVPLVAPTRAELAARFARELEAVGGTCVRVPTVAQLAERVEALRAELDARAIVAWSAGDLAGLGLERWCAAHDVRAPHVGADPRAALDAEYVACCAAADWGVTGAVAAIAATGTVVLACAPGRPRATSLLPAVHVAIVGASQLVARMSDLALLRSTGDDLPSQLLFVTGPSRTSDIENDLTIGVHGPAAVVVLLVDDR